MEAATSPSAGACAERTRWAAAAAGAAVPSRPWGRPPPRPAPLPPPVAPPGEAGGRGRCRRSCSSSGVVDELGGHVLGRAHVEAGDDEARVVLVDDDHGVAVR